MSRIPPGLPLTCFWITSRCAATVPSTGSGDGAEGGNRSAACRATRLLNVPQAIYCCAQPLSESSSACRLSPIWRRCRHRLEEPQPLHSECPWTDQNFSAQWVNIHACKFSSSNASISRPTTRTSRCFATLLTLIRTRRQKRSVVKSAPMSPSGPGSHAMSPNSNQWS